MPSGKELKERALEELKSFWLIATFLALVFGATNTYRRLILSEVNINYFHYGAGVIEALIVAKVVLIGQAFGVSRRGVRETPIASILVKTLLYGVLVALFAVLEHLIEGLIHGKDLASIWSGLAGGPARDEIIARVLMLIVALIPFFAFLEIDEMVGKGTLLARLFQKRPPSTESAQGPLPSTGVGEFPGKKLDFSN